MYIYMYIYIYIYVYICIYMYIYVYIYIYILYIYICIHTYVYIYICIYICIYIYVYIYMYIYICIYIYMYVYIYICIYIYTYNYIHIYIHIYTYIYIYICDYMRLYAYICVYIYIIWQLKPLKISVSSTKLHINCNTSTQIANPNMRFWFDSALDINFTCPYNLAYQPDYQSIASFGKKKQTTSSGWNPNKPQPCYWMLQSLSAINPLPLYGIIFVSMKDHEGWLSSMLQADNHEESC